MSETSGIRNVGPEDMEAATVVLLPCARISPYTKQRLWTQRPWSPPSGCARSLYRRFCKLRVLFVGVLVIRAVLFGVDIGAPDFWKIPTLVLGQ